MTKIQCVKDFECEICHRKGMLQILGNYGRVRHYLGLEPVSKKPRFEYHKQRLEYVKSILDAPERREIDLIGQNNIDLKFQESSFNLRNEWTGGDLNPRPPECKSGVHTN
jgi:hypothetical protein